MINLGEYNTLTVDSILPNGLYLSDKDDEFILLPKEEMDDKSYKEGDLLNVFVYRGTDEKITATLKKVKLTLNTFALLKVQSITRFGAFMDMGLGKDLMIPIKEQKESMKEGRSYIVYMGLDYQTNRLYGSSKIDKFIQNKLLTIEEKEKVNIIVYKKTDIGYSVIINNEHLGLIYENEVFTELNIGDKKEAYVKTIREDNKIDISLQAIGYENYVEEGSEKIHQMLKLAGGHLSVNDKSAPSLIYDKFGMSKKMFKKALGDLYRQRRITITPEGISIVK